jgi:hypothetical protein
MEISGIINNISIYSPLIALAAIPFRLSVASRPVKIIFLWIFISFTADQLIGYLNRIAFWETNNYGALAAYGFIESAVLFVFYWYIVKSQRLVAVLATFFTLFYLLDVFWWEAGSFNSYGRGLQSIVFILLSLKVFHEIFVSANDIFIDRSVVFWINTAVLIYFSGAFFSFALFTYFPDVISGLWLLHNISNAVKNLILGISLWRMKST